MPPTPTPRQPIDTPLPPTPITTPTPATAPPIGGGGRIAFVSNPNGNDEIYVMNADGSGRARLTNNSVWDGDPSWSPDGTHIAFASDRDGNKEIYVMSADGSGVTRLTDNPADDTEPAWSPDGTRIAFVSKRNEPDPENCSLYCNSEIYVMYTDGSGLVNLTNHPAIDQGPSWSSDGTYIAFYSISYRDPNLRGGIYTMNADGSGVIRLTDHGLSDWTPSWSPDGMRIAFQSQRDGNFEIYVMNADGSGQTNLTNDLQRGLSFPPPKEWPSYEENPSWSPDSTRIAFDSNRDGNKEIYVMNADGSGVTRLTNNPTDEYDPCWGP